MELPRDSVLLRIFVSEEDRADHQPLYQAIVLKARESRLAGATVLRGPMGYGRSAHLRTSKILQLSDNLPLIIEIVDSPENINAFLPDLEALMGSNSGLITLTKVEVVLYGVKEPAATSPTPS
jgi:PII-like signaling protein